MIMANNLINITEGENVTITCKSKGFPIPTVIWNIPNGARVSVGDSHNTGNENAPSVSRNLTITNASRGNTGIYICLANSNIGNVSSNISITVQCKCSYHAFIYHIKICVFSSSRNH